MSGILFDPWGKETKSLADVHATFVRWLGAEYDMDALDVVLGAAAVERLDGDPCGCWSSRARATPRPRQCRPSPAPAHWSLARSPRPARCCPRRSTKERTKDATGGLLRKLGDRGVLVIKDVTSHPVDEPRHARPRCSRALREVYDGRWSRNVGTDGGRTLDWTGRLVVVGAVTTAWDRAHAVIASHGRPVRAGAHGLHHGAPGGRPSRHRQHRPRGTDARRAGRRRSPASSQAVDPTAVAPTDEPRRRSLLAAADLVTRARTGVEYDYRGDVIDAHAPEMPTRFAKQLAQVVRGAVAIGDRREPTR